MTIKLVPTKLDWVQCVLNNFDQFLLDHASAEKKASGMALTLVSHYPDRYELVSAMTELAIEELNHFKEVLKIIHQRGLQLQGDKKDPYINQMMKLFGKGSEQYFVDRLLVAGIIEARGYERFSLIAEHLPEDDKLKSFYQSIARSESRHAEQFIDFAKLYNQDNDTEERLQIFIEKEGEIMSNLPIHALLH